MKTHSMLLELSTLFKTVWIYQKGCVYLSLKVSNGGICVVNRETLRIVQCNGVDQDELSFINMYLAWAS